MTRTIVTLALFLVLTAAVAAFGAQFAPGTWYAALPKPSWTPPNWLFGPVWTVLYIAIAVAGWLVWRAGVGLALGFWLAGSAFNGLWSWLFFGLHLIGLALADIVLLWMTILAFILTAWSPARVAALLFLPYLAWVTYAALLNFAIWRMAG